jgi:hypothetical protein
MLQDVDLACVKILINVDFIVILIFMTATGSGH